ncbi:MAG: rhodanese-like domain-containing protein [Acidobacteriota bacterium]
MSPETISPQTLSSGKHRTLRRVGLFALGLGALGLGLAALFSLRPWGPEPRRLSEDQRRERIDRLYSEYRESFPDVPSLSPEALTQRLESATPPPILVDVRDEREQEISMLPDALTTEAFEELRRQQPQQVAAAEIVTYCTIGYRSGRYAEELREQGLNAHNLAGSLLAWTHTGRPLEHRDAPVYRLHVWSERYDLAADAYTTTW